MSLFRRPRAVEADPAPAPAPPPEAVVVPESEPEPVAAPAPVVDERPRWQPRVLTDLEPLPAFGPGAGNPIE